MSEYDETERAEKMDARPSHLKAVPKLEEVQKAIEAVRAGQQVDLPSCILELAMSVVTIQRNQQSMDQAMTMAFSELQRGFRMELDAMAKALGLQTKPPEMPNSETQANTTPQ